MCVTRDFTTSPKFYLFCLIVITVIMLILSLNSCKSGLPRLALTTVPAGQSLFFAKLIFKFLNKLENLKLVAIVY